MIIDDDRFVVSGLQDGTVRVWDARSGKTIVQPLEHDYWVNSVFISGDDQRIVTVDFHDKVYLWHASTRKVLESATDGLHCARLLRKARSELKIEGKAVAQSPQEEIRIAIVGQSIYVCDSTRGDDFFELVGHFDTDVRE